MLPKWVLQLLYLIPTAPEYAESTSFRNPVVQMKTFCNFNVFCPELYLFRLTRAYLSEYLKW